MNRRRDERDCGTGLLCLCLVAGSPLLSIVCRRPGVGTVGGLLCLGLVAGSPLLSIVCRRPGVGTVDGLLCLGLVAGSPLLLVAVVIGGSPVLLGGWRRLLLLLCGLPLRVQHTPFAAHMRQDPVLSLGDLA